MGLDWRMSRNGATMPIVSTVDPYEDSTDPDMYEYEDDGTCPVCGEEAEWVYIDDWGTVVGCDKCLHERYVGGC